MYSFSEYESLDDSTYINWMIQPIQKNIHYICTVALGEFWHSTLQDTASLFYVDYPHMRQLNEANYLSILQTWGFVRRMAAGHMPSQMG